MNRMGLTSPLFGLSSPQRYIQGLLLLVYCFTYVNKHFLEIPFGFFQYHYGDFYFPIAIFSLFHGFRVSKEGVAWDQIQISLRKQLFLFLLLSLLFEAYLPYHNPTQTSDGWDVLAYALGIVFYEGIFNGRSTRVDPNISKNTLD